MNCQTYAGANVGSLVITANIDMIGASLPRTANHKIRISAGFDMNRYHEDIAKAKV